MASAADRIGRILDVLAWSRAHPNAEKSAIAERFGITVKQLDDDLMLAWTTELPGRPEAMIDLEYLDSDRVNVIDGQGLDRPLRLRPDEAVSLLVGLRTLAAVRGLGDREAVDSALAKIEDAVGSAVPTEATPVTVRDDATASTVRQGLDLGRRLRIRHLNQTRDEVSERVVDPLRLLTVDGAAYLEAWCHLSEAIRTFRLDRIVEAELLDEPAAPPEAAPPGSGPEYTPGADDLVAVLDLDRAARWVPEYRPCESVEERPDGSLRVTMHAADPRWLVRLVLRLGGHAVVLSPPELADDVRQQASEALAAYDL